MFRRIIFVASILCLATSVTCARADIISGSYEIGGNAFLELNTGLPFSGSFTNGAGVSHSLTPAFADVGFDLTGTLLTLTLDVASGGPINSVLDWDFTSLVLPGADVITGVAVNGGTMGGSSDNQRVYGFFDFHFHSD